MEKLPVRDRVSDDLRRLLQAANGKPMQVREILLHTRGRGLQIIAIILCLPFLSPVALPFISIPFGIAIAICGLRIAFRRKPWLPRFIMDRSIPYSTMEKMLGLGINVYIRLEKLLRPRWTCFWDSHASVIIAGIVIVFGGFFLSLPIPPPFPFTNTIPGFAIIFVCLGILERDGVLIFIGYLLTLLAGIYMSLIIMLGGVGIERSWKWLERFF